MFQNNDCKASKFFRGFFIKFIQIGHCKTFVIPYNVINSYNTNI